MADHVVLKLLKVLAEKPQYKPLSNARNVSTDPTHRILPKNFAFQPEITVLCLCSACARHCLGHTCSFGLGGLGLALRFKCGHSYKSHQESSWHICSMTLVQTREGCLKPGYSLQGEAHPWLLRLDMLQKMWGVYMVREVTIQQN